MEVYRSKDGSEIAVLAATWELNPRITFASLAPEFARHPSRSWRNFGSRLQGGAANLAIMDPTAVLRHVNARRVDPWDYTRQRIRTDLRGRSGVEYFIHIDLAKNRDACGVACVHRESTGVVVVDFVHPHRARPGQNIQFAEVREKYIYALHAQGFHIAMVTFDQWQSEESRQVLEGQGFTTDLCSADKTTGPYDTLIEMLLTDRLDYYHEPTFIKEMQQLRTDGRKYDHPKLGSKDTSDAVACATFTAIQDALDNPKAPAGKVFVHRQPKSRQPVYERGLGSMW